MSNQYEYFIRHTAILELNTSDIQKLFDDMVFGVHFESNYKHSINELQSVDFYSTPNGKLAIRYLHELAKNGGYIWVEYSLINKVVIGFVQPNSIVEIKEFTPNRNLNEFVHGKLFLKTLKMCSVVEVDDGKLLFLKARRPQQGTFVRWAKSYGKLSQVYNKTLSLNSWSDLSPDQQEVITFEYLSKSCINEVYHIRYLLMPIGRTLKDVDIYGVNDAGVNVFVQVTNNGYDKKKIDAIAKYKFGGSVAVYVGDVKSCVGADVIYIHYDDVLSWARKDGLIKHFL